MKGFKFVNNIDSFVSKLHKNEQDFTMELSAFIEDKMNLYVPVKSGYLKSKNSVKIDLNNLTIEAKNDADYAGFVEKGTRNTKEQPFITPSVYNHINDINAIAKRRLGDGL